MMDIPGYNRAQWVYDNMTPPEPFELSDKQLDEYRNTTEFQEWMMENAGNGDWVAFEERNCDIIYEMAVEYWIGQLEEDRY